MPLLCLLLGVFACSTSVLWIKWSTVDPVVLTGLRLGVAAAILAPFAFRDWWKHRQTMNLTHLRDAMIPGAVLAVHFITWILGARLTLASNGTLVVNMTPLVTPFLLAAFMGERVTRRETIATGVAALGLAILFTDDYVLSQGTLRGDLVCFTSMMLLALYLVLGRRFRHHPTNTVFVAPMFAFGSFVAFIAAPAFAENRAIAWSTEAPWILALAVAPTILGHSLILASLRSLRGQVVAVVGMTQFVFATLIGWLLLAEIPSLAFYPAAILILFAGVLVTRSSETGATKSTEADEPHKSD